MLSILERRVDRYYPLEIFALPPRDAEDAVIKPWTTESAASPDASTLVEQSVCRSVCLFVEGIWKEIIVTYPSGRWQRLLVTSFMYAVRRRLENMNDNDALT